MSERIPYERVWAGTSRIKCIIALTHPAAVILFSLATFILAFLTSSIKTDFRVTILLSLAMAAAQASNGVFNEVFDRDLDRLYKPWRAIPAGFIHPQAAASGAAALLCLGLLLALAVSPVTTFLLLGGTAAGILYSYKLKRTWLSWLPYLITYPSLPVWVLVAFAAFVPQILWTYLIAAPIAIGIHLVNQLRDFDEDEAAGIRGLAQQLGNERAVWAALILLIVGPVPTLIWIGFSGHWRLFVLAALASALHWTFIISLHWLPVTAVIPATFRSLFRRLLISCPLLLVIWYWAFLHVQA